MSRVAQKISAFSPQVGHLPIQQRIVNSFLQNRLPHAYLFYGPEGSGKEAFALEVAKLVNCLDDEPVCQMCSACQKISRLQHPDVHYIFPTPATANIKPEEFADALQRKAENPYQSVSFGGKNVFIGIDTIRELKHEAAFKLYEGKRKVYILAEADRMRPEAANALLKLLEEPPPNLMLILTTASIHRILPTIKSRCQLVRFSHLTESEILEIVRRYDPELDDDQLTLLIRLAGYNIRRVFEFLEKDVFPIREAMLEFLRKTVTIQRSQELMAIIEPLVQKKEPDDIRLLLWFMLLWFQDVLYLRTHPKEVAIEKIFHKDLIQNIEKFNDFVPELPVQNVVWLIEDALQQLEDPRNLNPLLILMDLAIKLHSQMKF
ncbi:MAG: DNA polymerase III subunit delta' [Calditrichaeota bacterium]|nr:DNA polymerase III subunit delta' [Calditrichota bacterium]